MPDIATYRKLKGKEKADYLKKLKEKKKSGVAEYVRSKKNG